MLVGGVCGLGMTGPARAETITVPGTSNIFGAGQAAAPSPGEGSGGTLPPVMEVTGGSLLGVLTASSSLDHIAATPPPPPPPSLIANGSFENTSNTFVSNGQGVMSLPIGSTVIPGWTVVNAPVLWVNNSNVFGPSTPAGALFLDLTGFQDNTNFAGVAQTVATTPGQQYALTLGIGSDEDNIRYRGPMSVSVAAGLSTTAFTFTPPAASIGNQWGSFTFNFTATAAFTPITITGTQSTGGQYLGLDNIEITAVPEPSTVFTVLGLLGLIGIRERSKSLSGKRAGRRGPETARGLALQRI